MVSRTGVVVQCLALALLSAVPWGCSGRPRRVAWNQHIIEGRWDAAGGFTAMEATAADRSRRSMPPRQRAHIPAFDDIESMFSYFFARLPAYAIVYPTERYYYFETKLGGRTVRGNFRLTDIARGLLHFAYYDTLDHNKRHFVTLGVSDGVHVDPGDAGEYAVTADGRTVTFRIARRMLGRTGEFKDRWRARLREHEEIVSGILDESGYPFVLVYNTTTESFYYILNDAVPSWEERVVLPGSHGRLSAGATSGYVFFEDRPREKPLRMVLVGVRRDEIRRNSYFDGPFDQVPPDLPLKERLETAYPYVRLDGGIDSHGNFVEHDNHRVAITPYQAYGSVGSMAVWLAKLSAEGKRPVGLLAALTYERKQDFHLRIGKIPATTDMTVGEALKYLLPQTQVWRSWPANHVGSSSRTWPRDHARSMSRRWPPNHAAQASEAAHSE